MRFYHVEIAAFAAEAEPKWIDNLLSHFDIPGVDGGRQGIARRISISGIRQIALIRVLTRDLGLGLADAVEMAGRLLSDGGDRLSVGLGLSLQLDRVQFERHVDAAVAEAVESVEPPRRGRPPKQRLADVEA